MIEIIGKEEVAERKQYKFSYEAIQKMAMRKK